MVLFSGDIAAVALLNIFYITILVCSKRCMCDEKLKIFKTLLSYSFVAGDGRVVADVVSGCAAIVHLLLKGGPVV